MKPLTDQLAHYAAYHRDRRNVATHFAGIPLIVVSAFAFVGRPSFEVFGMSTTLGLVGLVLVSLFYLWLDLRFGAAMTLLMTLACWLGAQLAGASTLVWLTSASSSFVIGWALQLLGHAYEGKKPAFLDDLFGLLIGPLFLVAEIAFALGLRAGLHAEVVRRAGLTHRGSAKASGVSSHSSH